MGRIMALDVGNVRIGVAVSDLMGIIANPLETYTRKGNLAMDAEYIANLAKQKEVTLFVSGLPLSLAGGENEQTLKTREFIAITQDSVHEILLKSGKYVVDAKSALGVYSLDLANPVTVEIYADDCDEVLEKLKKFQI